MEDNTPPQPTVAPLGNVEPHALMLNVPPDDQVLYKMMTTENLLRSIAGGYLHFNRVDSYEDFPGADQNDGQQLPEDRQDNARTRFVKAPDFSAADYYDHSRVRTYACCFSLENTDYIWSNYANGSEKGKVCIVFDFGKLRAMLNQTLQPGSAALEFNNTRCHQIFSVNYGIVDYVDWNGHQANAKQLPNPIKYTYLKDTRYSKDKELRVSLSAPGIGQFALSDGSTMNFPASLQMAFDFRAAVADGTIQQILHAPNSDSDFLHVELTKLGIAPSERSTN